jgi:hypothetical protein
MPPNAYRDRVFPPDEVRRILRRAAELEDAARPPRGAGRGHTLDEIECIAGDAGISEAALTRALSGHEVPPATSRAPWTFAGAPGRVSVERSVPGTVSPASHGRLAKVMRGAIGELGNAQMIGDSLSWSASTPGGRSVYAVVEPEASGRVTIRVEENLRNLRGGIYGGIMGGGGGGGFSLVAALMSAVAPQLIPVALVAWILAMYALARGIYGNRFRAREAELRGLADEISAIVAEPGIRVGEAEVSATGARAAGAADLDHDDDPDSSASNRSRRAGA